MMTSDQIYRVLNGLVKSGHVISWSKVTGQLQHGSDNKIIAHMTDMAAANDLIGILVGGSIGYHLEICQFDAPRVEIKDPGFVRSSSLCEACRGAGTYNGEVCWHCEGAEFDPVING